VATKNLSNYDPNEIPDASEMSFGIVVSEWNRGITENLLKGCVDTLEKHGVQRHSIKLRYVPGSFELPLGAQWMAEGREVDAVICLGSVIRGETAHFDFVCQACSQGVKDVALKMNLPVIFGVLTDDNEDQAIARSGGKLGNKGDEAAITAIKMVALGESF
jgi:6,7-dimethyl-8-ribityllumazine synthase